MVSLEIDDFAENSYTLDRMVSLLLGRPPGISDDDIDAELPSIEEGPADSKPMASAVHYIKLKQLESKIQRAVFSVGRRTAISPADVRQFLQALEQWEQEIPEESLLEDHWAVPCCSRDWFLLRAVEARLHLLRPLCDEEGEMTRHFLPLLAQTAAQGCELQYVRSSSRDIWANGTGSAHTCLERQVQARSFTPPSYAV
jgi:hypothetical protein